MSSEHDAMWPRPRISLSEHCPALAEPPAPDCTDTGESQLDILADTDNFPLPMINFPSLKLSVLQNCFKKGQSQSLFHVEPYNWVFNFIYIFGISGLDRK